MSSDPSIRYRHRHHRRRDHRHHGGRLSRRSGAVSHRHRPHRHLRGNELGQRRCICLHRSASARPQGHDAAIAQMARRPARAALHPARLSAEAAAMAVAVLARRRRWQLRGQPCRTGRADEARRSRVDGPDAAFRHARHAARRRLRWSSTKATPSSSRRFPAGRRATASASNTVTWQNPSSPTISLASRKPSSAAPSCPAGRR